MFMNKFTSTEHTMKSVKAAWDKAPDGPKKRAALTHFQAAEHALAENHETDCLMELDAVLHALA